MLLPWLEWQARPRVGCRSQRWRTTVPTCRTGRHRRGPRARRLAAGSRRSHWASRSWPPSRTRRSNGRRSPPVRGAGRRVRRGGPTSRACRCRCSRSAVIVPVVAGAAHRFSSSRSCSTCRLLGVRRRNRSAASLAEGGSGRRARGGLFAGRRARDPGSLGGLRWAAWILGNRVPVDGRARSRAPGRARGRTARRDSPRAQPSRRWRPSGVCIARDVHDARRAWARRRDAPDHERPPRAAPRPGRPPRRPCGPLRRSGRQQHAGASPDGRAAPKRGRRWGSAPPGSRRRAEIGGVRPPRARGRPRGAGSGRAGSSPATRAGCRRCVVSDRPGGAVPTRPGTRPQRERCSTSRWPDRGASLRRGHERARPSPPLRATRNGPRYGLTGMRERATALGGELTAGPDAAGLARGPAGFRWRRPTAGSPRWSDDPRRARRRPGGDASGLGSRGPSPGGRIRGRRRVRRRRGGRRAACPLSGRTSC